jgi:hypothetical protein
MMSAFILLGLGALITLIGYLLFLIDSFKVSVGWGLAVFFLPLANLVFLATHWAEGRRGFLVQLAGVPLVLAALLLLPKSAVANSGKGGFAAGFRAPFQAVASLGHQAEAHASEATEAAAPAEAAAPTPTPTPTPTAEVVEAQWDANVRRFVKLEASYMNLNARRRTLEVRNPDAVRAFNAEVAKYRDDLRQAQAEKAELLKLNPALSR